MLEITNVEHYDKWFEYEEGEEYLLRHIPNLAMQGKNDLALINECLLDWKGVMSGGEPIPCSESNKKAFLSVAAGEKRFWWIIAIVGDLGRFIDTTDLIKNLKRPRDGDARGQVQA